MVLDLHTHTPARPPSPYPALFPLFTYSVKFFPSPHSLPSPDLSFSLIAVTFFFLFFFFVVVCFKLPSLSPVLFHRLFLFFFSSFYFSFGDYYYSFSFFLNLFWCLFVVLLYLFFLAFFHLPPLSISDLASFLPSSLI